MSLIETHASEGILCLMGVTVCTHHLREHIYQLISSFYDRDCERAKHENFFGPADQCRAETNIAEVNITIDLCVKLRTIHSKSTLDKLNAAVNNSCSFWPELNNLNLTAGKSQSYSATSPDAIVHFGRHFTSQHREEQAMMTLKLIFIMFNSFAIYN